ncbi:hypothetical protein BC829DRAFT_75616 [Chytridium lagenaria]|nr:hypothetical protein BC829DRAFT_75616 [Chytridium lagenaria]
MLKGFHRLDAGFIIIPLHCQVRTRWLYRRDILQSAVGVHRPSFLLGGSRIPLTPPESGDINSGKWKRTIYLKDLASKSASYQVAFGGFKKRTSGVAPYLASTAPFEMPQLKADHVPVLHRGLNQFSWSCNRKYFGFGCVERNYPAQVDSDGADYRTICVRTRTAPVFAYIEQRGMGFYCV